MRQQPGPPDLPVIRKSRWRTTLLGVGVVVCFALGFTLHELGHGPLGAPATVASLAMIAGGGAFLYHLVLRESQQRHALEARNEALERRLAEHERELVASQRMQSFSILSAGVAHDFNNILSTMLPNVELARRSLPEASPLDELLREIESGIVRGAALSRRMLGYVRYETGEPGVVDLNDVVANARQLIHRRAIFTPRYGAEVPPVWGDATQLGQVVLNLLLNACDAVDTHGGSISVETGIAPADELLASFDASVGSFRADEAVFVRVADTGPGIPPGSVSSIFDPFFTTKETGNGLGLAASALIVRDHGGVIGVQTWPGEGTSFTVMLACAGQPKFGQLCGRPGLDCACVDDGQVLCLRAQSCSGEAACC